jgi:prepilin-type N-terminal cleavage/methylation domain-containing protein
MRTKIIKMMKKKYLIEPKVQLEIAAYVLLFQTLLFAFLYFSIEQGLGNLEQLSGSVFDSLHSEYVSYFRRIFFIGYVASMPCTLVGVILITHRLVGPLYRIKCLLRDTPRGQKIENLSFRKADFNREIAELINKHVGKGNDGFTLVELMIVTGMIGLLAAIAIPEYNRFSERARISGAKILLSSLYTSEQTFFALNGTYTTMLDALGFEPHGNLYFNIGFDSSFSGGMGGSCYTLCSAGVVCTSSGWKCFKSAMENLDSKHLSFANGGQFRAEAHGHVGSPPMDGVSLTIDETKNIQQWPAD